MLTTTKMKGLLFIPGSGVLPMDFVARTRSLHFLTSAHYKLLHDRVRDEYKCVMSFQCLSSRIASISSAARFQLRKRRLLSMLQDWESGARHKLLILFLPHSCKMVSALSWSAKVLLRREERYSYLPIATSSVGIE